jgi:hypothetical protein
MPVLRAAALYTLLTAALTWPLAARLHIMDAGDSAFFAWAIGWELHAVKTDPAQLPHGPIFHPLRHTLGFDEPILGTTALVAPLGLFTGDAVFLFNVARLLTFPLSALTAYLLARGLGCGEAPALFAGAAFAFNPIRTDQMAHLSTLGSQWLPLVLLFMHRYFAAGRAADALLAALFFALATYACGYHGLIGLAVLPPAALVLFCGRWRRLPAAVAAAIVAAVMLLPLYRLHTRALEPLGYERGTGETVVYSAAVESFLATTSWNRVYGPLTGEFRSTNANNLFPGLVLPILAAAGGSWLWRHGRRPSRDAIALTVMGLAAALVALGPELRFMGHVFGPGPFALARELVPAFRMIRVPSRAGIFIALALALLGAKALTLWRPRTPRLVAISALALAETLMVPIPMPAWAQVVDSREPAPEVYRWLAAQPGDPVVVELPMLDIYGIFQRPAYHESIYLVRQTHHWKPLANGYAGIEPAPYVDLRQRARRFPSADALAAFRERGVRYVILHRGGFGPNQWARIERDLIWFASELQEVARFGGDTVYELLAAP